MQVRASLDYCENTYLLNGILLSFIVPHIGHLHSLVTADILARFHRLTHPQQPVRFLTGTDQHGLKIQKAAREQGLGEKEFCDGISERFRVGSFFLIMGQCESWAGTDLGPTGFGQEGQHQQHYVHTHDRERTP